MYCWLTLTSKPREQHCSLKSSWRARGARQRATALARAARSEGGRVTPGAPRTVAGGQGARGAWHLEAVLGPRADRRAARAAEGHAQHVVLLGAAAGGRA